MPPAPAADAAPASGAGAGARPRPDGPGELFLVFTALALQGFGGVLPVAQRVLCEERRWLTREEFLGLLAIGQALPGPNICNLSILAGHRFLGWRGAAAALLGMLAVPFAVAVALAAVAGRFSATPAVTGALRGLSAASAGLVAGTSLKLAAALRDSPLGRPAALALGLATFALVALLRLPLPWTILLLGPPAWLLAWRRLAATEPGAAESPAKGGPP
jgi:chromate transporter